MVQAGLFQKSNPDAHYANAAYKFMRERVVKTRQNIAFFSADAKCKVPIGESGYPIAVVTRGKKVIVGLNAALKIKMCLYRSIGRYDTNPGGQATYHDGHKIVFSLWRKSIRTVECGILEIKKSSVKTLQIGLYSVF